MKQNVFFFRDAALRAYQGVMTLPRFCGDRKHKSDGIRVAKAEPLSASFSTTSARKRDSFASAAFLKTIRKKTAIVAMVLGRTAPDPRFGSPVELNSRHARGPPHPTGARKTPT